MATEIVQTQPDPAPIVNTDTPAFSRFRRLWNGGERRLAYELIKIGEFAEDEYAALVGEFPEIIDIVNGN